MPRLSINFSVGRSAISPQSSLCGILYKLPIPENKYLCIEFLEVQLHRPYYLLAFLQLRLYSLDLYSVDSLPKIHRDRIL